MRVHHRAHTTDARDGIEQHARSIRRGDDRPHTRPRRDARGGHLGCHPAAPPLRARATHLLLEGTVDAHDLLDERRVRVETRIGGEHAGRVGEQDEQVGVHEMGNEGRETIVVAEPDLVVREGVVLVDDGHGAELEQSRERLAGVEVLPALDEVVRNEQHLGGHQAVRREDVVVGAHQAALPGRGKRLQRRGVGRALLQPERGDTRGHRAGAHDDDVVAVDAQLRHLTTELLDGCGVDDSDVVGERRRADLGDDRAHRSGS